MIIAEFNIGDHGLELKGTRYHRGKMRKFFKKTLGIGRRKGAVLKNNSKTILVRLGDGNVIKRHKVRHNVVKVG